MGRVYLARHPTLERRVAVKILHPHLAGDPHIVSRFLTEARAAATIRHPNIVEVIDCGALDDGAPYILMEYLEGEPLSVRMSRGLLMRDAVDIAVQAAAGLGAAHARGIIHRDLKPENLFLVPDRERPGHERVKILDFGIAKLQNAGSQAHSTSVGALLGTPLYMSPEQCKGAPVDYRCDIYSLGVIFYELLCGRPPFDSPGAGALIFLHANSAPPPPRRWNPNIPHRLEAVVLRMLAKAPEARFQSMDAVRFQLEAALNSARRSWPDLKTPMPTNVPDAVEEPVREGTRKTLRRWTKVAFAVTTCAAVVMLGDTVRRTLMAPPAPRPAMTAAQPRATSPPPRAAQVPGGTSVAPDATARPSPAPPPSAPALPRRVTVTLSSVPEGASVSADGVIIGNTPTRFEATPSEQPLAFVFALDGYSPLTLRALPSDNLRLQARLHRRQRAAQAPAEPVAGEPRSPSAPPPPSPPPPLDIMTER